MVKIRIFSLFGEILLKDNGIESKLDNIDKKASKLGEGFSKVGKIISIGLTAPIVAAGTYAAKLASDFNESLNKVEVAFKGNAQEVKDWSDTTLKSFGLAKGTALDMASGYGDMATSMGLPTSSAAEMSKKLVGLAGDLASFKNIGISEANTALTAIFTGETESLKKLGIVMTAANLQEYAASQGIRTKILDMTQAEQTQLRYNYVMAKTVNAQGDFVRTGAGTANSARVLQESLKELGTTLGQNILPVITPIIQKISEMAQKFGELSPEAQKTILVVAGIVAVAGPLLIVVGSLTTAISAITAAHIFHNIALAATKVATTVATAAQWLWNAALTANPIGLVIVGITALVVAIGSLIWWYNSAGDAAKKAAEEEIAAAKKAAEEEIAEIAKVAAAKRAEIDAKLAAETAAYEKSSVLLQKDYDAEVALGDKKLEALKTNLADRQSALDENHNKTIAAIEDEYGVFEEKQKSKTGLVQDEYKQKEQTISDILTLAQSAATQEGEAFIKSSDAILEKAQGLHNEKMLMYGKEYLLSLGIIDDKLKTEVNGYQTQIDAIDNKTKEEDRIAKEQDDARKIIDLQKKVDAAKTDEEKLAANEDLETEVNRQHREKLLEQRQIDKDSLNTKITDATTKATEEKDGLLITLQKRFADELIEVKTNTDNNIIEIQREREAKETAETAKYTAAKNALDNESNYLKTWIDTVYTPLLDEKYGLLSRKEYDLNRINTETAAADTAAVTTQEALDTKKAYDLNRINAENDSAADTIISNIKVLNNAIVGYNDAIFPFLYSPLEGVAKLIYDPKIAKAQAEIDAYKADLHNMGIPGYSVGTKFLPQDMLIQAHQGEMIVPRSENPYANSGGGTMPGMASTDYDKLTSSFISAISKMDITMIMDGEKVGALTINRIAKELYAQ